MNFKQTFMTVLTVIAAVGVATALFAGGFGGGTAQAAITVDDETTNTGTVSDWVGGETVTGLDDEQDVRLEMQSDNATDGDSFTVKMSVNDADHANDNRTFFEDSSTTWTATDETNGHYEANFTKAEMFAELERSIDEDTTVDVTVIAEEGTDAEESTTFTITASNGDTQAVEVVTESDLNNSDGVETVEEDGLLGSSFGAEDYARVSGEEAINGSATDVRVVLAESTVEQKFTDKYDSESVESSEALGKMALGEDNRLDTFADSAGDDVESNDTYAVYDNNPEYGEHAHLNYNIGEDYEDSKAFAYDSYGVVDMSWTQSFDIFGFELPSILG